MLKISLKNCKSLKKGNRVFFLLVPRYEFSVGSDGKVPRLDPHQVVKGELEYEPALCAHFGVHWLPVLRHHCALVAVERDARLVERLFRVPQLVVELSHAALENRTEVARNQRPTNR